jgi:UDP-N-acetylglucosamine acyltransferase
MPTIHPTAIIDPQAGLPDDVVIGPYVIIEGMVELGPGAVVHAHSVLRGFTRIGKNARIGPAAYVGADPQHLGFKPDMQTWLIIGDNAIIRENANLHRAFKTGEENATRIGHDCFVMGTAHVGHDCVIGNKVILGHGMMLAGHVTVGDNVFIGGNTGVHQFVRIGRLAMVGGHEVPTRDIPPFAALRWGGLKGYNAVGCRRAGFSREAISAIRKAYHCYHTHRTVPAAVAAIKDTCPPLPEIQEILDFIAGTKRGIMPSVAFLNDARAAHDDE